MLTCGICGEPAGESAILAVRKTRARIDLCGRHLDELLVDARPRDLVSVPRESAGPRSEQSPQSFDDRGSSGK